MPGYTETRGGGGSVKMPAMILAHMLMPEEMRTMFEAELALDDPLGYAALRSWYVENPAESLTIQEYLEDNFAIEPLPDIYQSFELPSDLEIPTLSRESLELFELENNLLDSALQEYLENYQSPTLDGFYYDNSFGNPPFPYGWNLGDGKFNVDITVPIYPSLLGPILGEPIDGWWIIGTLTPIGE